MGLFEPDIMGIQLITDDKEFRAYLEKYHLSNLEILSYSHLSIQNSCANALEAIRFEDFNHHGKNITIGSILHEYNSDSDLLVDFFVNKVFIVNTENEYKIASDAQKEGSAYLIIYLHDFQIPEGKAWAHLFFRDKLEAAKFIRMLYYCTNSRHLYPYDLPDVTPEGVLDLLSCVEADSFDELISKLQKHKNLYDENTLIDLCEISDQYENAKRVKQSSLKSWLNLLIW
jgi:hypothetical protein